MAYSLYGSRRPRHEPSAYSVFNKDCESIDGTLTAEQFERELRYGPTNVCHSRIYFYLFTPSTSTGINMLFIL